MSTGIEVKNYKLKALPNKPIPNAILYIKADGDTTISTYITDVNGIPYPLKDDSPSTGVQSVFNIDGTISVIGTTDVKVSIQSDILDKINNAVQPDDLPNTKVEFNNQLTDGDFLFVGDVIGYTDEEAQDAVGNILTNSNTIDISYDDITPSIYAQVVANSITSTELSDNINISEFINDENYITNSDLPTTKAEFNTQLSDGDFLFVGDVTGGVQSVTGTGVDNTDPQNPVIIASNDFNKAVYTQKYFNNYFTSSTGLTTVSVIPSFIDGKMRLTGGAGNFNQYITLDGIKNTDENIEIEIIFKAVTVNAGSFGLAIGKKSINTWYDASIACHISPVQSTAYIWDPTTVSQLNNKLTQSISANDILKIKYTQIANTITCSYVNLTQNTKGQFNVIGNLSASKNLKIPNSSDICIWNLGGTMDIISIEVTSFSQYRPNMLCIGDSKTVGYSSTNNDLRWASNINILGTTIVNAGDGDRTVETTQTINYTKLLKAKYAILCLGRNDLASGVSSTIWQSNYQNIVNQLQSQGIIVIHLLPIPEIVVSDQSSLKNWIISTYGSVNTIDPSVGWNNSTMLSSDNVHPNEIGHAFIANKIINSGLIIPASPNIFPRNQELDNLGSDLSTNATNYIPYADSGVFLNSEIYRFNDKRYGFGTLTPYNFGSSFRSFEIAGETYGLLSLGANGSSQRWYLSGNDINGYIGVNVAGNNINCLTFFPDGGVQYEELGAIFARSNSAKVQIDSKTQGFLPPRMTNAQRISISSPAEGLVVYCSDFPEGLWVNKSTGWAFLIDGQNVSNTILSSASTLNLSNTSRVMYYTYTGSTPATWTLPTVSDNSKLRIVMYNTGTGIVTVNTNSGGDDIYDSGDLVNTASLNPGTRVELFNNSAVYIMS